MAAEVSAAQMVSSLQKRVRSKLRKHAGAAGGADGKGKAVDAKRVQWLAIQSRARKITPEQFEVLAKERVAEVAGLLERIADFGMSSPEAPTEAGTGHAVEELEKGLKLKQKEEETIAERLAKRRRKQ